MTDEFQSLADRHPEWPADVRARIVALAATHALPADVEYLPTVARAALAVVADTSAHVEETPAKADAPAPEPWITSGELAARAGVSTKTIARDVKRGMPCGGPVGTIRFKASECQLWRECERPTAAPLAPAAETAVCAAVGPGAVTASPPRGPNVAAARPARAAPPPTAAPVELALPTAPEPWVGIGTVAAHLACTDAHVRELVKRDDARRIPHRKDGHRLLFKLSRVDRWLDCTGC